ncbi:pyrophosphate-energized vacuolar membrane proton pump-like, partial [Zingiber officinale]|uniref:pyrophosphate-energized vacuolar membrane proton pump-like n=1 Tax=Zingiber officinale TaxID=94328 RepID=UPI001C4CF291
LFLALVSVFPATSFPRLASVFPATPCSAILSRDAPNFSSPRSPRLASVSPALKKQLIISTALMAIGIAIVTWVALPSSFTIFNFGEQKQVKNWQLFFCVAIGLWTGLVIGFVTEYYTSNAYSPVQDVADSCRTGAATNVIFRLALGYKSIIIPIFAIGFSLAAMYAMAVAALGMLSTIATGLAIDAYGPISESAGGNVEMAGMSHRIRERTENNIYHSIIRFSRFAEAELKLFHSQHR